MTNRNMATETTKPNIAPAPADTVKHDDVKAPTAPLAAPAVTPLVK